MLRVEFTIEPFVEGHPGRHVTAAIEAAQSHGVEVDVGPFGSSCVVEAEAAAGIVSAVTAAALEHGATHVTLHMERID